MGKTHNLWTFGCSHTYGHGLEDCYDKATNGCGPTPSKLGYASMLANDLKLNLINHSRPGAGNKHIYFRLQKHIDMIQPWDIVVLKWSYIERSCIVKNDKDDLIMFGPWMKDKIVKAYYKNLYYDTDAIWETINYINLAELMLRHLGIKTVIHIKPPIGIINKSLFTKAFDELRIKKLVMCDENITDLSIDNACDGVHPGPKTQRIFADHLRKFIEEHEQNY